MVRPALPKHFARPVTAADFARPITPARYDVEIGHRRRDPLEYAFLYHDSTWLVDVDELPRMPRGLGWLASFAAADHFDDPAGSVRDKVDGFLLANGVARPHTVLMLASPRVLGYVFNPLSVFYCLDHAGRHQHTVAEVRNTYGGRHCYLLEPDDKGRSQTPKRFYVSPFNPVDGQYSMRLPVPGADLLAAVTLERAEDRPFTAVMTGHRAHGGEPPSLWSALASPLATRAVMLGIKRHGIILYLKGLRPYPRESAENNKQNGNPMSTQTQPAPDTLSTADRWPDVVTVPHQPLRGFITKRLVRRAFGSMPIRVRTADGEHFGQGDADSPEMWIARPRSFYQRVGSSGLIGFGEAFMAGDWTSDRLADVLTVMAGRMSTLIPPRLQRLRTAVLHARPSSQDNTVDGARDNIHRHYDLSNDLFGIFLDESMTYSSALFDGDPDSSGEELTTAQHRKIDRLLDIAGVGEGSRVLEIGTGWGELAIRAAGRGAHVTTVTISTEQAELANKRVAEAGLSDRVDIRLQDYREVTGQFDAVVSVEMIEAVGANHWSEYFTAIAGLLVDGGRVGLQAITMPHDRMLASMDTYTWIVKYIFPGGLVPSVRSVRENVDAAGLRVTSELTFGLHYAETLRRWRAVFEARTSEVHDLDFDTIFCRMWSLYLAYSEAGFRSRYLDVVQFGLVK